MVEPAEEREIAIVGPCEKPGCKGVTLRFKDDEHYTWCTTCDRVNPDPFEDNK